MEPKNGLFDAAALSRRIDSLAGRPVRRSHANRWLTGVAGGIGEAAGVNPNIIRALFALLAVTAALAAIIVYLLGVIILPEA
ncbi:PspC domain-containing protein [Corynebacterium sphenisci]|uniref:PspC domain-containing protein n=1 Tax=Corynebacterium sphenisci TaxID=191493 RepID=UPI0026DFB86F|nr:PspC domain-containing protein [Corynebacterium sphenisci]MDO5731025.1 PspC domain-containing protein [Corynebacterium sphenisci]